MTMQIKHLEYLVALSREKHFAHAAVACHVTQPTLSAGIKQLEENLGILIVERGQRFRGFTPQGERVLGWARRILGDVDALQRVANESDGELIGRLRLGVVPSALAAVAHPDASQSVGLIVPERDPPTPLAAAFLRVAETVRVDVGPG